MGPEDGDKEGKKALAWNPESKKAFDDMKATLPKPLSLHLLGPDKGFVLRTDASKYGVKAVLEQVQGYGMFLWRSLAESWPRVSYRCGHRGRRRHTPLCAPCASGQAKLHSNQ